MQRRPIATLRPTHGVAALALLAALAGGCAGNGRYTSEHSSAAQQKMAILKAGTEWDMGRQAFLAGDLDKALKKVDASLSLNDQVPKSHVLKGRIQLEQGDLGGALESLHTAEALDPQNADAQYFLGVVYERLDQLEVAYEHFSKASELDDYNPSHAVAAAEMLIDLDRLDEAREYLESGPGFEHHAGVRLTLGHIAMMQGESELAVELFEQARLLSPESTDIVEELVRAQIDTGRFREAELNLATLLDDKANASRRDLQHMRCRCLLALDRPVDARQVYHSLTRGQEGQADVEAWIGLGNVSFMLSDNRTLRQAASRVVALDQNRHEGYALTAMWFRRQGDNEAALESVHDALSVSPDDANLLAFQGMVLMDLGRFDEARQSLVAAPNAAPNRAVFRNMLLQADQRASGAIASEPTDTE